MSSKPIKDEYDSDEKVEPHEKHTLSKEDLIRGKMVRCQILRVLGDRLFSSTSNAIWIAFENTEVDGLLSAYCPINGKVYVRKFQSSSIANKTLLILRTIRHKNVLGYIDFGMILTVDSMIGLQFSMITEWCSGQSLFNSIHKRKNRFGLYTILEICQQIIQGLAYLHSIGFIQCNITSFKIFLREDNTIKIGNYRIMETEKPRWTWWSAPEERYHVPESHRVTHRGQLMNVDIYAFGIIAFELVSQTLPYNCVYNDFYLMNQIEKNRICPKLPNSLDGSPQNLVKTAVWSQLEGCLSYEYYKRPTLQQISCTLEKMKEATPNYLIPAQHVM